jgi:hypothetical protein
MIIWHLSAAAFDIVSRRCAPTARTMIDNAALPETVVDFDQLSCRRSVISLRAKTGIFVTGAGH